MKKLFISILSVTVTISAMAQTEENKRKERFNKTGCITGNVAGSVSLGFAGIGAGDFEYLGAVGPFGELTTPLDVNVGLLVPFSIGFNYTPVGRYTIVEALIGKYHSYGLNISLYAVNTKHFSMQFVYTPSIMKLKPIALQYEGYDVDLTFNGRQHRIGLNFNFLISEYTGIFFGFHYINHIVNIKQYDSNYYEIEDYLDELYGNEIDLSTHGVGAQLGVVFKLDPFTQNALFR